jgi:hypothetical protein
MTKVYSLAIFDAGDGSQSQPFFYWNFLPGFLRGFYSCFPDWQLWIYHDSSIYHSPNGDVLMRLARQGKLKLIYVGDTHQRCKGMLWRMRPIWEGADIVACRDVDGLPYPREYKCVEEWIKSGKGLVHVIHDSESHHGIMGGTSTWRAMEFRDKYKSWDEFVSKASVHGIDLSVHGADQILMNKEIPRESAIFVRNPPKEDKRDDIGPHIGAGFSSTIISDWYDRNEPNRELRSCEIAYSNVNAVMGCDGNHQYVGALPLTCKVWNELNNARGLVIMAGDKETLLRERKREIDWTRDAGARIFFTTIAPGFFSATTAQVGRLFAYLIPWIDENADYLLTTDADMWPLSKDWFAKNKTSDKVTLFYSNAYNGNKFPLCYVSAYARIWKEVMLKSCEPRTFMQALMDALVEMPPRGADPLTEWCFDEQFFSAQIKKWPGFPSKVHMVERRGGPPVDRIDRSKWPGNPDITRMVDAHLVRPAEKKYGQTRPILSQLMTPEALAWCDAYVEGSKHE